MHEESEELLDEAQRRLNTARSSGKMLSDADLEETFRAIKSARLALKSKAAVEAREDRTRSLQLLLQALIPISVAFLAWQLPLQQRLADQELARISLIPDLMDDLFSGDPEREELSVRVTQLVLKDEGDTLLAGLLTSPNVEPTVKQAILDATLITTIDGLFDSPDKSDRQRFYDILKYQRNDKLAVIDGLVNRALKSPDNDNGIFNAAQLLSQISETDLKQRHDQLLAAIPIMEKKRDGHNRVSDYRTKKTCGPVGMKRLEAFSVRRLRPPSIDQMSEPSSHPLCARLGLSEHQGHRPKQTFTTYAYVPNKGSRLASA